jgi:hypothetical protein
MSNVSPIPVSHCVTIRKGLSFFSNSRLDAYFIKSMPFLSRGNMNDKQLGAPILDFIR